MISAVEIRPKSLASVTLPLSNPWGTGLAVTNIEGIGPTDADIFITNYGSRPGGFASGSRIGTRTITLHLEVIGANVESIRQTLYRHVIVGNDIDLIIHTDYRSYWTKAFVESFDPNIFSKRETFVITMRCPDPFFREWGKERARTQGFEPRIKGFEFPWENTVGARELQFGQTLNQVPEYVTGLINYPGSIANGMIGKIEFYADPGQYITVRNQTAGGYITFENVNNRFGAGGTLWFSTQTGNRFAYYSSPSGERYDMTWNLWNYGDWPILHPGDNIFTLQTTTPKTASITFEFEVLYSGV